MCTCMPVCVHVCVCICMHVCMHICTCNVYVCVYVHSVCAYMYMHVYPCLCTCVCAYMYTHVCPCLCICVCACVRACVLVHVDGDTHVCGGQKLTLSPNPQLLPTLLFKERLSQQLQTHQVGQDDWPVSASLTGEWQASIAAHAICGAISDYLSIPAQKLCVQKRNNGSKNPDVNTVLFSKLSSSSPGCPAPSSSIYITV